MKWIMLSVLACFVAHEAKAQRMLGRMGMAGLGTGLGTGLGYGDEMFGLDGGLGMGGIGVGSGLGYGGLGFGTSGSGYTHGNGFGANDYNFGANGLANQGMHNTGMGNYHDIGQRHNSLTSITQAENTDNHNIGGGQMFDTGLQSGNRFNQYGNGGSRYGNGYGSGQQMTSFL